MPGSENEARDGQQGGEVVASLAVRPADSSQSKPKKRKNKEILTAERARQAGTLWRLAGPAGAITDEQVAEILGVTYGVLRGWIRRNAVPQDPNTHEPLPGGEGLRDTRARARAQHVAFYLGKVHHSIEIAEQNDDPHGVRLGATWMLEKLNPKMFDREMDEQGQQQTGVLRVNPPKTSQEWQKKWSPSAPVNEIPAKPE